MLLGAPAANAHAFLDHAEPAVGSSVSTAPAAITLWFTQDLEPAFSAVEVTDQSGNRMDGGDAALAPGDATRLQATLKRLQPGTYKVNWHVVSVDTHRTEGEFSFTVAP
jgi:methionine-rich copper-binding protein CopC